MPPLADILRKGAPAASPEDAPVSGGLRERAAYLRNALMRVVGAPDYATYLARHRVIHPEVPPMSEAEFFRFAIDRKYSKAGPRCC